MGKAFLSVTENTEHEKENIDEDFSLLCYIAFFFIEWVKHLYDVVDWIMILQRYPCPYPQNPQMLPCREHGALQMWYIEDIDLLKSSKKLEGKLLHTIYKASITLIPNPYRDTVRKKLQTNIPDKHRYKNLQQNINKSNSPTY